MSETQVTIDQLPTMASRSIAEILNRALSGDDISVDDAVALDAATGNDLHALVRTADALRKQQVGDDVSYVINRNINFTNVCVKGCKFCAFSRDFRSEQGYLLPVDEVVSRAKEAAAVGATEICVQAGLVPKMDPWLYVEITRAVRAACPDLHIHAFSPEEIKYGAGLAGVTYREYLLELKAAGLNTLPGTSAEILDEPLRRQISPGRITAGQWIEVVRAAHEVGVQTSSTMMFGHLETAHHRASHLALLREMQRETGGFTEFVPLSFVHAEAPLFLAKQKMAVRAGPSGNDVIRLYAIARLMLGTTIRNVQASWVKEGVRMSQWLLSCGVNDLGGTLINESISTSAGSKHGQLMRPSSLRRIVRDAGRVPVQRNTVYEQIRRFEPDDTDELADLLDQVEDADTRFGSYSDLTRDTRFKFEWRPSNDI